MKRGRVELEWESVRQRRRGRAHCDYASVWSLFVGCWLWRRGCWLLCWLLRIWCWTKGRVEEKRQNQCISCINFLCGLFVAARRNCWAVSSMLDCVQQGISVVAGCSCWLSCSVLWRCGSEGKVETELGTLDFCCWQVVCFIATRESFEDEWSGVVLKRYTGWKEAKMKGIWLVCGEFGCALAIKHRLS